MGSAGEKRKGRRHLPKVRGRYSRGGGVVRFDNTPWGPMNVLDGGRDAPTRPLSTRARVVVGVVLAVAVLVAAAAVVVSL